MIGFMCLKEWMLIRKMHRKTRIFLITGIFLKSLCLNCTTAMLAFSISPIGCRPGILFDKAEVHKSVIYNCSSLRYILDAINTRLYKLENFLVPILSPITINEYTAKDFFASAKEITKTDCKYFMACLGFESLLTNIPLEETIERCVNDLFFDKSKIDNLTKQNLYDLLSAAAKESFFDKILYRQTDGVAMGSPLGPT